MILLTPEQMKQEWVKCEHSLGFLGVTGEMYCDLTDKPHVEFQAQAQLRKVVEWGEELCQDYNHRWGLGEAPRRECTECWCDLKAELGGE